MITAELSRRETADERAYWLFTGSLLQEALARCTSAVLQRFESHFYSIVCGFFPLFLAISADISSIMLVSPRLSVSAPLSPFLASSSLLHHVLRAG